MQRLRISVLIGTFTILVTHAAYASPVQVEMLNKRDGELFVYSPDLVRIAPGESVSFVPTTKGHNVESIKGMLPEGVDAIKLGFNEASTVTFTAQGVYGIRCTPHTGAGMEAAIIVGETVNLAAAMVAAGQLHRKGGVAGESGSVS